MKEINLKQQSPAKTLMGIVKAARAANAAVADGAEKIRTAEIKDSKDGGRWCILVDGKTLLERGADKKLHGVKNAGMAAVVAVVLGKGRCKMPPAIRVIAGDYIKSQLPFG